jgi:hypothetical protein
MCATFFSVTPKGNDWGKWNKNPGRQLTPSGEVRVTVIAKLGFVFSTVIKWLKFSVCQYAMTSLGRRLIVLAPPVSQPLTKGDGGLSRPFQGGIIISITIYSCMSRKKSIYCVFFIVPSTFPNIIGLSAPPFYSLTS